MKRQTYKLKTKMTVFIFIFLGVSFSSFAQEITEENYLKLDTELWEQYGRDMEVLWQAMEKYPEKEDSLTKISQQILETASAKNRELAMKYASVPSGLRRLFMVRLDLPKDTLSTILARLPEEMQNSPHGKQIRFHIESEQIKEGDRYYDFEGTTSEGKAFKLSSLKGKEVLFIYGGMGCMGKNGRTYLNTLYENTSRENFEIVVYCLNSDPEGLQNVRATYPCDFILVSDFLQDESPVKVLYGAQGTPTCFFINKEGIVSMKTGGLHQQRVNELVKR